MKVIPGYTVLVQLYNKETKEKQNQKNFLTVQFPLTNNCICTQQL